MMLYFIDCTEYVRLRDAAETRHPALATIAIDNYEELMKNATDSEKSAILADIDRRLSESDARQQRGPAEIRPR